MLCNHFHIHHYLHSTMVLFKLISLVTLSPFSPAFTFHYGPIQIYFILQHLAFFNNLHSTMVLFKLTQIDAITSQLNNLHSTMVLFKLKKPSCTLTPIFIYIPLWSYSNVFVAACCSSSSSFTFHYGPIQMFLVVAVLA